MDREAWWATVHEVEKSQMQLTLSLCPSDLDGKESACGAGDPGSIPEQGRFPDAGNGSPLQYSCLEISVDRQAWWATVHMSGKESGTTEQLTLTRVCQLT